MDVPTEWLYLDRSGKEFGPFRTEKMGMWFARGFFPIGSKLLVRAPDWPQHVPVHELYPDGEPFNGPPRSLRPPPVPAAALAFNFPPAAPPPPPFCAPLAGYACGCYPPPSFYPSPGYGCGCYPPPPGPPPFGYPPPPPPPFGYGPPMERDFHSRSRSRFRSRRRGRGDSQEAGGRRFKPHHTTTVPRATDLGAKFASDAPPTTAMLRNIPNKYTQEQLLEEIDAQGFAGSYDFFYLPIDVKNNANVGYAFVNFLEAKDFERFCVGFRDYHFKRSGSKKIATVSPAVVQGLRQNVENLMRKRVAQGQHGPVLLQDGRRVDLESAAAALPRR